MSTTVYADRANQVSVQLKLDFWMIISCKKSKTVWDKNQIMTGIKPEWFADLVEIALNSALEAWTKRNGHIIYIRGVRNTNIISFN